MDLNKVYYRHVIERFLNEKEIKEFDENYKENRFHHGQRPPENWEKKMATEYSKGIPQSKLMRDYGIRNTTKFYTAITRVFKYQK